MTQKKRDKHFKDPKKGEPAARNNGKTVNGFSPAKTVIRAAKRNGKVAAS